MGVLWDIIQSIVLGGILGYVGRALVPGKQNIPLWLTIVVGIVAAYIGKWIATALGVADTSGIDWIEIIIQVIVAAIGVAIVAGVMGRKSVNN